MPKACWGNLFQPWVGLGLSRDTAARQSQLLQEFVCLECVIKDHFPALFGFNFVLFCFSFCLFFCFPSIFFFLKLEYSGYFLLHFSSFLTEGEWRVRLLNFHTEQFVLL